MAKRLPKVFKQWETETKNLGSLVTLGRVQLQHNHPCFHSLLSLQALYGKDPPQLLSFEKGTTAVSSLEEQLIERDATLDELTYHMTRWQEKRCVL